MIGFKSPFIGFRVYGLVKLTPNLTANSTADEHRRGPQHADLIPGINALFVITPEEVRRLQTTHQAIFFLQE
jgi:hypothetical protein